MFDGRARRRIVTLAGAGIAICLLIAGAASRCNSDKKVMPSKTTSVAKNADIELATTFELKGGTFTIDYKVTNRTAWPVGLIASLQRGRGARRSQLPDVFATLGHQVAGQLHMGRWHEPPPAGRDVAGIPAPGISTIPPGAMFAETITFALPVQEWHYWDDSFRVDRFGDVTFEVVELWSTMVKFTIGYAVAKSPDGLRFFNVVANQKLLSTDALHFEVPVQAERPKSIW